MTRRVVRRWALTLTGNLITLTALLLIARRIVPGDQFAPATGLTLLATAVFGFGLVCAAAHLHTKDTR